MKTSRADNLVSLICPRCKMSYHRSYFSGGICYDCNDIHVGDPLQRMIREEENRERPKSKKSDSFHFIPGGVSKDRIRPMVISSRDIMGYLSDSTDAEESAD